MPTTKTTFCRICEAHCPLLADIDDHGKVVKLHPHKEHPVAKGFACHKGISFLQVHNDPDRLNAPQRRKNSRVNDVGDFETISWGSALADIGAKIKSPQDQYGPDCVAIYSGNPIGFNSRALILSAKFAQLIGAKYSFSANTQDLANKYAASQYVFGSHSFTIPDLEHTDFLCATRLANPTGICTRKDFASPPASIRMTRAFGSSLRRLATTAPALPAPTTM